MGRAVVSKERDEIRTARAQNLSSTHQMSPTGMWAMMQIAQYAYAVAVESRIQVANLDVDSRDPHNPT